MNAEILAIGTELLLGEIVDTNTSQIARWLREIGIDVFRTGTVGDNVERIALSIQEATRRAGIVITTGGLGPTVDDPTRQAVAKAMGVELEFRPELWDQIQDRFARYGRQPTENNRRQALVPIGANAIENRVGTAPALRADLGGAVVICLPGVPAEMATLMQEDVLPYLRSRFHLAETIRARVLRTAGAGESWLDERIADLERLTNPTVGLSAHPGQVDIRITAKGSGAEQADAQIAAMEKTIRERLGDLIYGVDDDTLVGCVARGLRHAGWKIAIAEWGTSGSLATALTAFPDCFLSSQVLPEADAATDLNGAVLKMSETVGAGVALAIAMRRDADRHLLHVLLHTPHDHVEIERSYGGPAANAPTWATNTALDMLRRSLA